MEHPHLQLFDYIVIVAYLSASVLLCLGIHGM